MLSAISPTSLKATGLHPALPREGGRDNPPSLGNVTQRDGGVNTCLRNTRVRWRPSGGGPADDQKQSTVSAGCKGGRLTACYCSKDQRVGGRLGGKSVDLEHVEAGGRGDSGSGPLTVNCELGLLSG